MWLWRFAIWESWSWISDWNEVINSSLSCNLKSYSYFTYFRASRSEVTDARISSLLSSNFYIFLSYLRRLGYCGSVCGSVWYLLGDVIMGISTSFPKCEGNYTSRSVTADSLKESEEDFWKNTFRLPAFSYSAVSGYNYFCLWLRFSF